MRCPQCGERLYVADTISDPPDKDGVIRRIRMMECRFCDYTNKDNAGHIPDVWYLSRTNVWVENFGYKK